MNLCAIALFILKLVNYCIIYLTCYIIFTYCGWISVG